MNTEKVKTTVKYGAYYGLVVGIAVLDFICYITGRGSVAANRVKNKLALQLFKPKKSDPLDEGQAYDNAGTGEFEEVSSPVDKVDSRSSESWDGANSDNGFDIDSGADMPTQTKLTAVDIEEYDQKPEDDNQDKPTAA